MNAELLQALVINENSNGKPRGECVVEKTSDDFFGLYPLLYSLLREKQIGKVKRELSRLSVRLTAEGWTSAITEPASGRILFSVSDSLIKLWEVTEGRLGASEVDWRPDKWAKNRKAR